MSICREITEKLFEMRDEKYRVFQSRLIPSVNPDSIIGVRTPQLREYAGFLLKRLDVKIFIHELPHRYFEENQLHAFIISALKDYSLCIEEVNRFLPYVDNWATCDQMSPAVFRKHRKELVLNIEQWIRSEKPFTVRFGIGMLMRYFLDDDFLQEYLQKVVAVRTDDYYVMMMVAWYFATALSKQYPSVLPLIENRVLDWQTHNNAIQKALESNRIPEDRKQYLRTLKRKK